MSKHAPYVPKHRKAPQRPLAEAPKKVAKTTLLLSTLAVGGTGTAVAGGIALHSPSTHLTPVASSLDESAAGSAPSESSGSSANDAQTRDALLASREDGQLSRSADRRTAMDPTKEAALATLTTDRGGAITKREDLVDESDPRSIASSLLPSYGWDSSQMGCLDSLWNKESGWRTNAYNPSGAYGIPQALPGSKMASAGPDWQTNPVTQIKWGLGYIQDRYGSPCGAWAHSEADNWY